jgi:hypothetical protein
VLLVSLAAPDRLLCFYPAIFYSIAFFAVACDVPFDFPMAISTIYTCITWNPSSDLCNDEFHLSTVYHAVSTAYVYYGLMHIMVRIDVVSCIPTRLDARLLMNNFYRLIVNTGNSEVHDPLSVES